MPHSIPSLKDYVQADNIEPSNAEGKFKPVFSDWQVRQSCAEDYQILTGSSERPYFSYGSTPYLQPWCEKFAHVSQDQADSSSGGDNTKRKTWDALPVEVQLKIIGFLNEAIKQANPSLKPKVPPLYNTRRASGPRRPILSRGFLAPLTGVSKSFAALVNVFVWQALNLGVASVSEILAIEKRLKSSDLVGRNVRSLSLSWYEPQYNNVWAVWFEEPVSEAGVNILNSITRLISLELILNESPPNYRVKPLSERVKTLGRERMSNLRSFRLLTTWPIQEPEEELLICMLQTARRLKRFECHSGPSKFRLQYDPPLQQTSVSEPLFLPQSHQLPSLLASFEELECLAVSCESCLNHYWTVVEWKSKISWLSVSDFAWVNWDLAITFIRLFWRTLVQLELITDYGLLSGQGNKTELIFMPNLETLKLRIRSGDLAGDNFDFLKLFSTCPKISSFELVVEVRAVDSSVQATSLIRGLGLWPKLASMTLSLVRLPKQPEAQLELERIRQFFKRKQIDFQLYLLHAEA
ncbi:hypothetical protein CROQUDRAFT_668893 [Cronartium quercuum f. sp. fusiforme G11]|uniref:Uncharacterized protein n=1 Tax=Cronartium quercuum f. sp. fusiforme G11 TaxID=708437 RepID=A0A9P6TFR4_9BASI|nr:hypothetical protein CROQUDRAFT_668893 [Cronartium quercuum f. sp. fusiforme G11]